MIATLQEPADILRKIDVERLDMLWRGQYPQAKAGSVPATLACLRIMERRAKLLGLDAPTAIAAKLENTQQYGVLVVPGMMDEKKWLEVAARSQDDLLERERTIALKLAN